MHIENTNMDLLHQHIKKKYTGHRGDDWVIEEVQLHNKEFRIYVVTYSEFAGVQISESLLTFMNRFTGMYSILAEYHVKTMKKVDYDEKID